MIQSDRLKRPESATWHCKNGKQLCCWYPCSLSTWLGWESPSSHSPTHTREGVFWGLVGDRRPTLTMGNAILWATIPNRIKRKEEGSQLSSRIHCPTFKIEVHPLFKVFCEVGIHRTKKERIAMRKRNGKFNWFMNYWKIYVEDFILFTKCLSVWNLSLIPMNQEMKPWRIPGYREGRSPTSFSLPGIPHGQKTCYLYEGML